ncbi:MAG TPA: site-specific DNA-methyltransferase [Thermoplasmata archaeon]|nr:site-specific DNA-methyltransferase [Thermoplasmata archaeon]
MPPARPFARLPPGRGATVVLWCEDAIAGLPRRIPAGGADVVVTSPPYNRKVPYSSYSDDRPRSEYLRWIGELRDAVDTVLSPQGSFFLNVGSAPSDPFLPLDVAREIARTFVLQNVIHWVKSIAIDRAAAGRAAALDRDLALGHYRPMASDRYVHGAHEYVFHFSRRGDVRLDRLAIGVPYQDKSNVARWGGAGADLRCRGNTWFLPYPTIRFRARDRPHPASFPPELPEWCLRLHGRDRVRLAVDPFVGIGSSAVAAVRLGLPFVGFDVDREYLAVAVARVRAERTQPKRIIPRSAERPTRAGSRSASASG